MASWPQARPKVMAPHRIRPTQSARFMAYFFLPLGANFSGVGLAGFLVVVAEVFADFGLFGSGTLPPVAMVVPFKLGING